MTHGDAAGTRASVEVPLLHRHMSHEHVAAGLATALQAGALTADAVALQARKFAETDDHPHPVDRRVRPVSRPRGKPPTYPNKRSQLGATTA